MESKPDYSIRVIGRMAGVLNCFTRKEPVQSLIDITRLTGLHKSTVFRILDTLEQLKWLRRDPKTGTYRLGFGLFELGSRAIQGLDFYEASFPHLKELVKVTRQTVHLVVHDSGKALYVNKVEGSSAVVVQPSQIGLRLPLYCTAVGKVLLSDMPSEKVTALLEKEGMARITANTIDQPADLFNALARVREKGYALDDEEIQVGLRCVAAPVRDFTGKVIAAISVSGLSAIFSEERLPFFIEELKRTTVRISAELGWNGP